jgi:tetratricopeptide (TPR) repeat protein
MGEYEKALADYGRAIKIDPQELEAYLNRGIACYYHEFYECAIADSSKTIELESQNAGAFSIRGLAYADTGETQKAIADLEKALALGLSSEWEQKVRDKLAELRSR